MGSMNYYPTYVPDEGPLDAKILFVGEAPGEEEVTQGRPFVGTAGQLLTDTLNRAGLQRSDVRLANLCHYRPYMNKFENIKNEDVVAQGVRELYDYIREHRPNVIVPLGNWPLHYITGLAKFNNKKQISGIAKWRGSIVSCLINEDIKVIPTYHPSYVARDRSQYPIFNLDIKRIASDSTTPDKNYTIREYVTDPRGVQLEEWVERLCKAEYLAIDIETKKKSSTILCVGFAPSSTLGVCIVPTHYAGRVAIERILQSQSKKIFQFGSFDYEQLFALNGYQISDPQSEAIGQPYWWDTLIAAHIWAPELPRSLEFLGSIYTREPYYKKAGRANIPDDNKGWDEKFDRQALYEYNAKDCCVTYEVFEKQQEEIAKHGSRHLFNFEMRAVGVAGHISRSGMPIDKSRLEMIKEVLLYKWHRKQMGLDGLVGRAVNVNSNPIVTKVLYDKEFLGLPVRRNRNGGVTADEDAIVSLISYCKDKLNSVSRPDAVSGWTEKLAICKAILEIRGIRKMLSTYINAKLSPDGRLRSTYKVGGTETGRWSAIKFVDGTGLNSQTMPRNPVEVPDDVYEKAMQALKDEEIIKAQELMNELIEKEDDEDDDDSE